MIPFIAAMTALSVGVPPVIAKPVLLELFTSQGCSSCPPADKVLAEAAKIPGVVAISRPITYWDRLGWKDTLARAENTRRQRDYRKLSGRPGVYTPQIVIDGDWEGNGADRERVLSEVRHKLKEATPADVSFTRSAGGRFVIQIAGNKGVNGKISLLAIDSAPQVAIDRGENRGRRITYTNVVKAEFSLGTFTGGKARYVIDDARIAILPGDRIAVVVQEEGLGDVLGAAIMERRKRQ